MTVLCALIKRNIKLFFKDKGMFFTSLITPAILLVLYATFLGNVYRDSFLLSMPRGIQLPDGVIEGCVGGQLISSILAVSAVTVSFCSNMLMVQDRANGTVSDLTVTPVKPRILAVGYYAATLVCTLVICLVATACCFGYMAATGWFLSVADVLLLLLDVFLLVLFGTALSSLINFFLSTQGQIAAVGSIVSSTYGFVCGAYMPISQFSKGLQTVISFLPGTYGTSLVRNHALRGAFSKMEEAGIPAEAIKGMGDGVDYHLYFFDEPVSVGMKYAVLAVSVVVLLGAYVLLNTFSKKKR